MFFVGRLATRARLVQRLSRSASERQFAGSSPCEGLSESVFGGRGHGTARHGTVRSVGAGRAGASVLSMHCTASIASIIDSSFSVAVVTVCSLRIFCLSSGRAMSRQQKFCACGLGRVERHASGALTAGAPRAGARDMRASRAGRLAEGQRCAIRASFGLPRNFYC